LRLCVEKRFHAKEDAKTQRKTELDS